MKIYNIYDNGGKSWDRYTVMLGPMISLGQEVDCLGLSDNCDEPGGYSMMGRATYPAYTFDNHLGKSISFSELPKNVQKHIISRLSDN